MKAEYDLSKLTRRPDIEARLNRVRERGSMTQVRYDGFSVFTVQAPLTGKDVERYIVRDGKDERIELPLRAE